MYFFLSPSSPPPATFDNEDFRFTDVVWFNTMTSTGTHEPVVVLYMNMLYTGLPYKLILLTQNPRTNDTGTAEQLIDFSPAPRLVSRFCVFSRLACQGSLGGGGGSRVYGARFDLFLPPHD